MKLVPYSRLPCNIQKIDNKINSSKKKIAGQMYFKAKIKKGKNNEDINIQNIN